MKRIALLATAIAVLFCLSGLPLMAQGRGGGGRGMGGGAGMGNNPGMGNAPMMGPGMGQDRGMGNGPMMGRGDRTGTEQGRNGHNNPSIGGKKTPDQLVTQNTKLASKLQPLLPSGTNLQDAAAGFKNLGQFVAAVHVSHNLGIPFDQLKNEMIAGDSLGKAVHQLNPNLSHKDTKAAVKKGKQEAKNDIKSSNS
jgi:hypothetical protein